MMKRFKNLTDGVGKLINENKMKNREMTTKKLKARYLIIVKGYNQKEAAKIVGVSQKTMVIWVRKYKWNDEMTKNVNKEGGLNIFMELFFIYVRSVSSEHIKIITSLWNGFLKSHEKQIE